MYHKNSGGMNDYFIEGLLQFDFLFKPSALLFLGYKLIQHMVTLLKTIT